VNSECQKSIIFIGGFMFCPKCKAEYRDGFTKCFDCDVDLINELYDDTIDTDNDKKILLNFYGQVRYPILLK